MKTEIRIREDLYIQILEDLLQENPDGSEKIGFILSKVGNNSKEHLIILPYAYLPVSSENYINDPKVGARINTKAIREILQKGLETGDSIFHIHLHMNKGIPSFSYTDKSSMEELLKSFQAVSPLKPHGFMLLSMDKAISIVQLPKMSKKTQIDKITSIGYPLKRLDKDYD